MIKATQKKIAVSILIFGISVFSSQNLFAQTVSTSTPVATSTPTQETPVSSGTSTPDILPITTTVQEASTIQTTIPSSTLESTINPNTDISTTTPITESATSTPVVSTTTPTDLGLGKDVQAIVDNAFNPNPLLDEPVTEVPAQVDVVSTIDMQNLTPKSEYSFKIGATKIATKKVTKDLNITKGGKPTISSPITTELSTAVDDSTGTISVSGACSLKYFVVLLYKNADDYANNQRSYILNKAFPCTNGSYTYSIKDLPDTLQNGTYYLLVGEMGDEGGWNPITALTPIDINRN